MPILKRINKYQGLKDIDVLVEESGLTSKYFNILEVPENIPKGTSSFLLAGSQFLKPNVELRIEILDSRGQPIYTEPIINYLEGNARRVSIEVYDDTAPGDGFLYVCGELREDYLDIENQSRDDIDIVGNVNRFGRLATDDQRDFQDRILPDVTNQTVPEEFRNVYNVRYIRPIFINSTIPNTERIIFHKQPSVSVSEIVKGYVSTTPVATAVNLTGSVSVDITNEAEPVEPNVETGDGKAPVDKSERDKVGRDLEIFKNRRREKINVINKPSFTARGRVMRRFSPETEKATIKVSGMESGVDNSNGKVSSAMVGATLTINNPKIDEEQYPSSKFTIPTSYTTKIKKVKNSTTLIPQDEFFVTDKSTGVKYPVSLANPTNAFVTLSLDTTSLTQNESVSTTHFRSFADITVGNLRTFSGDVYKAKLYTRSKGTLGDFEPVYETVIESPQLLIDPFSPTGFKNTGFFHTQSIIDDYWLTTNGTATKNDDYLIDGVLISGSNFVKGTTTTFTTSGSGFELENGVVHTIKFNSFYFKESKEISSLVTENKATLKVYLSGSATTGNAEEDVFLGEVDLDTNSPDSGQVDGVFNTFISSNSGDPKTRIRFEVEAGRWVISDVELKPYSETNFNPDYFRMILPMPHPMPKKPDQYDFLVEFYTSDNQIAETFALREDVNFAGAPINIDGDGNLLSGSMYLGNVEGSGIEMHGGSAYVRTIGYNGFDNVIGSGSGGFMMFSGSVGTQIQASETGSYEYQGVGLEIVDAHTSTNRFLRFRTNPSIFEVVTDQFFLGSENSSFVSGALGNIEISSSNFHLTAEGDVTMSGTISATAGNIGDFQIIEGQISGSNITMNAPKSQIFKTDQGPGSDTSATFDQLRDEYYIDFTPSGSNDPAGTNYYVKFGPKFMVDKDGLLIASGATFEGSVTASAGLIGGFTTDSSSFHSTNIFISGSPLQGGIDDPKYMFISTSNFNVKENGDVTGSSFLLDGGTITDNVTILGSVSANSILTPAIINGNPSTEANASSSISSEGFAKFVSASIAGFIVNTEEIKSSNENLRLKSSGQITGSNVLFDGGTIGGFDIVSDGINSTNNVFQVTGSTGQITGSNVLFTGGKIGGFTLSSTQLSATNFTLDTSGRRITLGSSDDVIILDADEGIQVGDATFEDAEFSVDVRGNLKSTSGSIAGWEMTTSTLTGGNVTLNSAGSIKIGTLTDATTTATTNSGFLADNTGNVLIKGNTNDNDYIKISGGGSIDIKAQNFDLDAGKLILDSGTNNGKIALGSTPPSAYNSGNGFYVDGNEKFLLGSSTGSRIQFDGSTFTISSSAFELDTSTIDISSTDERIQVFDSSGNEYVRIGEISDSDGSDDYGMKIYDGSGTADGNTLVKFGEEGNRIAGWTIDANNIFSDNLFIRSSGIIETADFASNLRGWRISAEGNGSAEFENVRIRGTLSTAVFEKETVNAVGGQLYVANSTSITGSTGVTASHTTMSVVNSTGFTGSYNNDGEILSIKKVTTTGFSTEYVLVQSSSRDFPTSETNFAGKLYVVRGYSGSSATNSGSEAAFVGDLQSTPQNYEEGQVIVSTGRIGSGYIRLNANPNDTTTPYIDIVERTGSAIYDVDLKARIGDLSGVNVSEFAEFGITPANAGFGIYTQNGFFTGGITATTGSITGRLFVHTGVGATNRIIIGTDVNGSNDGISVNDHNYWYTTGAFKVGSSTNFLSHDGSGDIQIQSQKFELNSTDLEISSTNASMSLGMDSDPNNDGGVRLVGTDGGNIALGSTLPTTFGQAGIFMSGSGGISLFKDEDNYLVMTGSVFDLRTQNANLSGNSITIDTTNFELSSSGVEISSTQASMSLGPNDNIILSGKTSNGFVQIGNGVSSVTDTGGSNKGVYIEGDGDFILKAGSNKYLQFNSGELDVKTEKATISGSNVSLFTPTFYFGDNTNFISGSGGNIEIFNSGTTTLSGSSVSLFTPTFYFGDNTNFISGSNNNLSINTTNFELNTNNLDISSANQKIDLGSGKIVLDADGGTGGVPIIEVDGGEISGSDFFVSTAGALSASAFLFSTNLAVDTDATINFGESNYQSFAYGRDDSLKIVTGDFNLTTTTLIVSSSNSGVIALGSAPPQSATAGSGIFLKGDGTFLFGNTSGNHINFDGSTLGIKTTDIDLLTTGQNKIKIDSTGTYPEIALGRTTLNTSVAGTERGIYMNGSGSFLVRGDGSNFIKMDASSATLELKSDTFQLDASTIIMDSATNNGKIQLGPSGGPGSATGTSNGGAYIDGQGRFNFVGDANNYIRFSATGLEVNTDDFTIAANGDVVSTGTINSNTGTFGGTSNGWTIATGKLHNAGASGDNDFIGLVHSSQAHADVGSVSAFYAGADANTGQDAQISFGGDGKIRGTGIYVRRGGGQAREFLISAETIFGGGEDGDVLIQPNGSTGDLKVWTSGSKTSTPTYTSNSGTTQDIVSPGYGDVMMKKYSTATDSAIQLERDVYVKRLILDIQNSSLSFKMNGFRLFASEGIFVYSDSGGSSHNANIFENGRDGANGSVGSNGFQRNNSTNYLSISDESGGSAGSAGSSYNSGTLVGVQAAGAGGAGGAGKGVSVDTSGGSPGVPTGGSGIAGSSGTTPTNPTDGLSNTHPMINTLGGRGGAVGGAGGRSSESGAAQGEAGASSAASVVQAGIQYLSTPADSIIKVRGEFGSNDYAIRLTTAPSNPGGTGGSGGSSDHAENAGAGGAGGGSVNDRYQTFSGGGGGGGGGAGSNGGIVLVSAKIIDYYNTSKYSVDNGANGNLDVYSPGNNTQYGKLKMSAVGGNGGDGGNGGQGGGFEQLV